MKNPLKQGIIADNSTGVGLIPLVRLEVVKAVRNRRRVG